MAFSVKRISLKAPPPRVVLVPDSLFFVRVVPIGEGVSAGDVSGQVQLALEGLSPFPLAQLYYAHYWVPGSRTALVYAAYRKRFTAEQLDTWAEAEMVIPAFAALLNARVEPATTLILNSETGITVLHWEKVGVPSAIASRSWAEDTDPAEKLQARDELLNALGGSKTIIDVEEAPKAEGDPSIGEYVFRAGEIEAPFTREELDALDIRDKADLAGRRKARARDLYLWRAFVGCAAGVALAALLEVGLIGGRVWQRTRQSLVEKQAPVVAEIMRAQTLSTRIEELSTKRLRPFEMITIVDSKRPRSVTFVHARTSGLNTLEVEAQTNVPNDLGVFQAALRQLPDLLKVDVQNPQLREGMQTFRLLVTFKPDAFRATQS